MQHSKGVDGAHAVADSQRGVNRDVGRWCRGDQVIQVALEATRGYEVRPLCGHIFRIKNGQHVRRADCAQLPGLVVPSIAWRTRVELDRNGRSGYSIACEVQVSVRTSKVWLEVTVVIGKLFKRGLNFGRWVLITHLSFFARAACAALRAGCR